MDFGHVGAASSASAHLSQPSSCCVHSSVCAAVTHVLTLCPMRGPHPGCGPKTAPPRGCWTPWRLQRRAAAGGGRRRCCSEPAQGLRGGSDLPEVACDLAARSSGHGARRGGQAEHRREKPAPGWHSPCSWVHDNWRVSEELWDLTLVEPGSGRRAGSAELARKARQRSSRWVKYGDGTARRLLPKPGSLDRMQSSRSRQPPRPTCRRAALAAAAYVSMHFYRCARLLALLRGRMLHT